jgi:very-short-patch-repair endonuclease
VTRRQLLELGFSDEAVDHRIEKGRLHHVYRGVFAVGRPELTREGRWMAAVLRCGAGAGLAGESAAALYGIRDRERQIELCVPAGVVRRVPGLRIRRRKCLELARRRGIPVTDPVCTLVDLAAKLPERQLEAAVNEADVRDVIDPEALLSALDAMPGRRGVRRLRRLLERATFTLTDSELERLFLRLVKAAGLPRPLTGQWVNGYKVDFYWPDLGLVVETDGLRYHRTPAQQARDRRRDQAHTAAGLVVLRFTHHQVAFEPSYVQATLAAISGRRGPTRRASRRGRLAAAPRP